MKPLQLHLHLYQTQNYVTEISTLQDFLASLQMTIQIAKLIFGEA